MNALAAYDSDDASSSGNPAVAADTVPQRTMNLAVNSTPGVAVTPSAQRTLQNTHEKEIFFNPSADAMWAPAYGPVDPYAKPRIAPGQKNVLTGYAEDFNVHAHVFESEYNSFNKKGEASNPSDLGQSNVRDTRERGPSDRKRKRETTGNAASDNYLGPWAKYEREGGDVPAGLTEEQRALLDKDKAERGVGRAAKRGKEEVEVTSVFHLSEDKDYQGRSWVEAPRDLAMVTPDRTFLPKRCIHTYTGHTKGVNAIRLFPKSAHLILSAGLDGKLKIWDVETHRKVVRTYLGHAKGCRDIAFNNDGRKFLSTSYDRTTKLWDTETGQMIHSFTNGHIPICCKFNPDEDKNHEFLVGQKDKKILQWDERTKEIIQTYDRHLGEVNTITFVDENRRIMTTSDDKSIRVWEYGINAEIKIISDPSMHSMPAVAVTPNGKFAVCQSQDNQILTFTAGEKVRLNKKKRFLGHLTAGYACGLGVTPDMNFLFSGDSDGRVVIWDWKRCKQIKTIRAHQNHVCIDVQWHPYHTSRMFTCSWDGTIKLWD